MFKLSDSGGIIRIADGARIPADPGNSDYAEHQRWLAAGNTIFPADPPTAEQTATKDATTKNNADAVVARAHVKLNNLKAMTPAQVQNWVTTNVTTLAQVQDAVSTLAVAVSILARRL